jgi:hypothetical protein
VIIDDDVEETCLDAEGRSVDLSALDFLASTASLMAPIETKRKSDEIEPGSNLALAPAPKRKVNLSPLFFSHIMFCFRMTYRSILVAIGRRDILTIQTMKQKKGTINLDTTQAMVFTRQITYLIL